jgi:hypothetical protein
MPQRLPLQADGVTRVVFVEYQPGTTADRCSRQFTFRFQRPPGEKGDLSINSMPGFRKRIRRCL